MKERIKYIDIAKGFLILYLVLYHFPWALGRNGLDCKEYGTFFRLQSIVYCFFMPAFFILSGYCSSFKGDFKTFFIKNTKTLVAPIICFSLISYLLGVILNGWSYDYGKVTYGEYISFWFLSSLYLSKLGLWVMQKVKINKLMMLFISLVFMTLGVFLFKNDIGTNFFAYKFAMCSFPFVTFGYIIKDHQKLYNYFLKFSIPIYALTFISYVLIFRTIGVFVNNSIPDLKQLPLYFILAVSGTLSLLYVSKKIGQNKIFEYYGRDSIIYYCANIISFPYIVSLVFSNLYLHNLQTAVLCCMLSFMIQLIVWFVFKVLLQYKPFSWMLGKF